MARGGAQRNPAPRAEGAAQVAKRPEPPRGKQPKSFEDQLFFSRLRRRAKWVFVFLAVVFMLSFVLFGVGSGSSGLGDMLNGSWIFGGGGAKSATPGIRKAQKLVTANARNASAYRALSTAYQAAGRPDEAIAPLVTYTQLKRKDSDALLELAALYGGRAQRLTTQGQIKQAYPLLGSGTTFLPDTTTQIGKALGVDPSVQAVQSIEGARIRDLSTGVSTAYADQVGVYKKLVLLDPQDANLLVQLGQAQQQTGDTAGAIASFKAFLKLAPDDPLAGAIQTQLKSLQPASSTTSKVPSTSGN